MDGTFSIIHFNSRSLNCNFTKIKDYLNQFTMFDVVAISETWLDEEKETDVRLEGYELYTTNRLNRKGGGVALLVNSELKSKKVQSMSIQIDNMLECVTIEIEIGKNKSIIISCIYRTPGSCIDSFNDKIINMYDKKIDKKMIFVCGDFNIDLLKSHDHGKTKFFIDTLYSLGLFPTILKPTRITTDSATLIDNIFTNTIENKIISGLLLNDISDHLPVFTTLQYSNFTKKQNNVDIHKTTRHRTPEAIEALKEDLREQRWTDVYTNNNPNKAYEEFLSVFTTLYDKHCPRKIKRKAKYDDKPWITRGLENACKKKNLLYRHFLKNRTKEAEHKYKRYKNKLISIMRHSKKEYYHKQLELHKNNTQGIWKVLNGIIKKHSGKINYPKYFIKNNQSIITETQETANEFNKYFVNVGYNLAKEIVDPVIKDDVN